MKFVTLKTINKFKKLQLNILASIILILFFSITITLLYELMGYKGQEPFYDFLNELRKSMPIMTRDYFKINNGFTSNLPQTFNEKVHDYKIWQYYKMNYEKVD